MSDIPLSGFTVNGDAGGATPLVLASPHSGREYPPGFLARTRLTLTQLRRAEDAFVDALLEPGAAAHGVPLIAARYGRAWLDLNRDPAELDPAMFTDPLPGHPLQRGERVAAGLGVVPRVAAQGLDIYGSRLRLAEAHDRIEAVHAPYHARVATLCERARARHGYAILLDCHSMPALAAPYGRAPRIVLGDLHGQSAAPALLAAIERQFEDCRLTVARNNPYAGGHTTARHGLPAQGIHVVQLELDRTLYMDPARLIRHPGFERLGGQLAGLVGRLLELAPGLGLEPPVRLAAE